MTITSVSVFESLAYQKIKQGITEKLDDLLREIAEPKGASEGEKNQATAKCLEMFQAATDSFVASKVR